MRSVGGGFSALELDALRETGNVAAGGAATSLSGLLGRSVRLELPRVREVGPQDLEGSEIAGGEGAVVAFAVTGRVHGRVFLLADAASVKALLGFLPLGGGGRAGEDSALKEIGNIICGAYLNALARWTGLTLLPSVPDLEWGPLRKAWDGGAVPLSDAGNLLIETRLRVAGVELTLVLLFTPGPGALEALFDALARSTGVDPRGGG